MKLPLHLPISLVALLGQQTNAYITSGLPRRKQIAWLKKMTVDICESPPGALTDEMLKTAPEIMSAWAHSTSSVPDGTECALAVESLLKRVVDERRAGNDDAIATTADYNCMLEGWATSGAGVAAAERCERILMEMQETYRRDGDLYVQPNLDSFKAVLLAWRELAGVAPYAPHRAQRILELMVRLYQEGNNGLAAPDSHCFELVMQTWARSRAQESPNQTEKLLVSMERLYHATGRQDLKPTTSSFNAVLAAWARSSGEIGPSRAAKVLKFMEQSTDVEPDMASYSTVVGALARTIEPENARLAETFMKHVEGGFRAGQVSLEPDALLYNCVIGCLSKTNTDGAYRRARAVLDRQIQLHDDGCESSRPDVYGFTAVISTCATESKEPSKSFQVALATFQQLRHTEVYGAPNHVTYGSMLKCCARLLSKADPMRRKWTRKVFQMAVTDGCVGDVVLGRLREAASPELFKELLKGVNKKDLPEKWTRNVYEKRDVRRKNRRRAEV